MYVCAKRGMENTQRAPGFGVSFKIVGTYVKNKFFFPEITSLFKKKLLATLAIIEVKRNIISTDYLMV